MITKKAWLKERERLRQALNGYKDSDLGSLAETLCKRNDYLEAENKRLKGEMWKIAAALEKVGYDFDAKFIREQAGEIDD